jgi:hypothetical protein
MAFHFTRRPGVTQKLPFPCAFHSGFAVSVRVGAWARPTHRGSGSPKGDTQLAIVSPAFALSECSPLGAPTIFTRLTLPAR